VLRILPPSLEPQRRWEKWVETQRRSFSQRQAGKDRPEGKSLKENLEGGRDPVIPLGFPAYAEAAKGIKGSTTAPNPNLTSTYSIPEFAAGAEEFFSSR
jgi:hypothetical protein